MSKISISYLMYVKFGDRYLRVRRPSGLELYVNEGSDGRMFIGVNGV